MEIEIGSRTQKADVYGYLKKYSVIYADPPWFFKTYSVKGKMFGAERHYPTMQKEEIQNVPVKKLSDKNCVLFLWVTAPCLIEGIELITAWGFKYKTVAFTWVKQNKKSDGLFTGMGYYTRANAEYCLLATKGKILERKSHGVHSVVLSHIERHSKKPDEVRDRIVRLFGDVPRIELFARQYATGWDCWGNEV